ncbi:MnmC family methyltransferase [Chlorogloeopsis sp. ULAP01]|uniref:tRNA (5-methylaminomethyl-2-thiouridine)(34)-methyltransferase MnmD n=1 Tax=Chlorogloeopsis sp. ULAP01 TaxID=3056483 RepID=UPI0025AB4097|nr:MnmC family methyltransferase [Chlorogloeopsis sp. ULAP01]MDM9380551.1 MnmC family methyltransferase [Chlorogloeopsis sp. ULAP01]
MSNLNDFTPELTADGSFTFFSKEFSESFHSHYGARQESFFKFVEPTQLTLKANKSMLRLLDVCYGLGYNTAAALQSIWAVNPDCYVEIIGLEQNPAVPQAAIAHHLFDNWNYEHTKILTGLAFEHQIQTYYLRARLLIGDARITIGEVYNSGFRADAIFLDPFSPPQCPQLWTVEFIKQLALCLHEDALLATYSCAAAVRTALLDAGLQIGSTPPVGRRSPGTVAAHLRRVGKEEIGAGEKDTGNFSLFASLPPLSQAEQEHLLTRAAIPYRDPQLQDSADVILKRRQQEQQASSLEPTSRWRKRWLSKTEA